MTEKMYGEGQNAPVSTGVPFFKETESNPGGNQCDISVEASNQMCIRDRNTPVRLCARPVFSAARG